jgi:hypothetical protein
MRAVLNCSVYATSKAESVRPIEFLRRSSLPELSFGMDCESIESNLSNFISLLKSQIGSLDDRFQRNIFQRDRSISRPIGFLLKLL